MLHLDSKFLDLDDDAEARLIDGARDERRVKGLTHDFYKYPARFSPAFARAAIEVFTKPGDIVLDQHVGGGTTAVEAVAAGRRAVGIDISSLAEFVSAVKTTVLSEAEIKALRGWAMRLPDAIDLRKDSPHFANYAALGYYKHLHHPARWRLRKAVEQGLAAAEKLEKRKLQAFARCVVLRAAQWALDGRRKLPSIAEFRECISSTASSMIAGATAFRTQALAAPGGVARALILNRSAIGMEDDQRLFGIKARLVLTSPPYPGVHVLYHRWQVDGRKESPLPFMIAQRLDGSGGAFYTMGDRKERELTTYFESIQASMRSAVAMADSETTFVQMLAFSNVAEQLPRYLDAMCQSGLEEVQLRTLRGQGDGRLWRSVPGRRWYSDQRGETPGSREVVLLHRKAPAVTHERSISKLPLVSRA